MRLLVTGGGGLLGRAVARAAEAAGICCTAAGRERLDVTDAAAVREAVRALRPDAVVHCAALTDVDACELDPQRARSVNGEGCRHVAEACAEAGLYLVAVSTDYVFDGRKGSPYVEDDLPAPVQVYGRSKLAGEEAVRAACERHAIVRSAWIYGPGGKNYFSRLFDRVRAGEPVRAVIDQRGSPTFADDLATAILRLVDAQPRGTFHLTNAGGCSAAEFCAHALAAAGVQVPVEGVRLADLARPAPRPADTTLANVAWLAAGFPPLRPWTEAAAAFARLAGGGG